MENFSRFFLGVHRNKTILAMSLLPFNLVAGTEAVEWILQNHGCACRSESFLFTYLILAILVHCAS